MNPSIPSLSRRVWGLLLTLLLIVAIALLRPNHFYSNSQNPNPQKLPVPGEHR